MPRQSLLPCRWDGMFSSHSTCVSPSGQSKTQACDSMALVNWGIFHSPNLLGPFQCWNGPHKTHRTYRSPFRHRKVCLSSSPYVVRGSGSSSVRPPRAGEGRPVKGPWNESGQNEHLGRESHLPARSFGGYHNSGKRSFQP